VNLIRPRNQITTRANAKFMELRNEIYRQISQ
jgi:hypothetical protein